VQLRDGSPLSATQVGDAIGLLLAENILLEDKSDFLIALSAKGETPEEIAVSIAAEIVQVKHGE